MPKRKQAEKPSSSYILVSLHGTISRDDLHRLMAMSEVYRDGSGVYQRRWAVEIPRKDERLNGRQSIALFSLSLMNLISWLLSKCGVNLRRRGSEFVVLFMTPS